MNQVEVKRKQIQLCSLGLGLIVLRILGKQIGDNGVTYLMAAVEVFTFVWALISMQLADTLGKMLRTRNAKGQYKNADKLKKCICVFQGSLGIIFALLCLGTSRFLAESVLHVPYSRFLIMLMAPVILFRTLNDVLQGLFQGEGSELPSAVSCLLRQFMILGFGILFGKMLAGYGEKVSRLLGPEAFTAMYGAMGVVLGILLAEVFCLIFLLLIYKGSSRKRKNRESDGMKTTDSFAGQIYSLYSGMPVLCGILEILPLLLGFIFYQRSAGDSNAAAENYGVFFGKYIVVTGVVLMLLMAMVLPVAVKASALFRKDDHRYSRNVLQTGLKSVLAYALFFTVFVSVMAKQLAGALSDTYVNLLADMLATGSVIILFGLLAFLCYTILKLSGRKILILICLAVANVVFLVLLLLGLKVWKTDVLAIVYAGLGYSAVLAISLCVLVLRQFKSSVDWIRTLAVPVGSSCISGLLCYLLGKLCTPHLGNLVTLIVAFVVSFAVHWIVIMFLRCYSEQEMEVTPGKLILKGLGQMLGAF